MILGSSLFNGETIAYSALPLSLSQDAIVFDGYSLQNTSIITTLMNSDNLGGVDLNTFNFPRDDGGAVLTKYYRGREILLKCTLKATTAALFSTLLDEFKKNLRKTDGYLDITINSEIRRIKATVVSITFDRNHWNITYVNATVTFRALEPFFYAKDALNNSFLAKTATFAEEVTNTGSGNSLPAFYFIFGAGTATTETSITMLGKTMTVTNSLVSGDILIIDSANKSITKNGTQVDYTGIFPAFPPGSCPFTVTFTGTTLADVTVIYPKNYL